MGALPGDYAHFRSLVPERRLPEYLAGLDRFLDALRVDAVHVYGTALGGFLAQLYAAHRPRRVKSLLLSNTFLDTARFAAAFRWSSLYPWAPDFVLKRMVLQGLRETAQETEIADSIDFVVSQLEHVQRAQLASRLLINTTPAAVPPLPLGDESITIMDTNDYSATPRDLRDAVYRRYPGARKALLKSGGDFPFLSRADEVALHVILHLRRASVQLAMPEADVPHQASSVPQAQPQPPLPLEPPILPIIGRRPEQEALQATVLPQSTGSEETLDTG
eukprot:SM000036S13291  [mRNA]  locus=s36:405505:407397:+ [translate_table: standard]